MNTERDIAPILVAEKRSIAGLLLTLLDTPVLRPRIFFGTLEEGGTTVKNRGGKSLLVDQVHGAKPGDAVIIHEI